jgi:hypothetical protein
VIKPANKTQENNKIVENTIIFEINKRNLPEDAKFLVIDNPRTSTFYLLPKIHKVGNPGRPIISTYNCPTERISSYIDDLLQPLVKRLPTYIKDSTATLRTIQDTTLIKGRPFLLFTMDVKSLYTVISHEDGLKTLP